MDIILNPCCEKKSPRKPVQRPVVTKCTFPGICPTLNGRRDLVFFYRVFVGGTWGNTWNPYGQKNTVAYVFSEKNKGFRSRRQEFDTKEASKCPYRLELTFMGQTHFLGYFMNLDSKIQLGKFRGKRCKPHLCIQELVC